MWLTFISSLTRPRTWEHKYSGECGVWWIYWLLFWMELSSSTRCLAISYLQFKSVSLKLFCLCLCGSSPFTIYLLLVRLLLWLILSSSSWPTSSISWSSISSVYLHLWMDSISLEEISKNSVHPMTTVPGLDQLITISWLQWVNLSLVLTLKIASQSLSCSYSWLYHLLCLLPFWTCWLLSWVIPSPETTQSLNPRRDTLSWLLLLRTGGLTLSRTSKILSTLSEVSPSTTKKIKMEDLRNWNTKWITCKQWPSKRWRISLSIFKILNIQFWIRDSMTMKIFMQFPSRIS